jgi:hypothetical protein
MVLVLLHFKQWGAMAWSCQPLQYQSSSVPSTDSRIWTNTYNSQTHFWRTFFLGNIKTEPEISFKYITKMHQYVCIFNVKPTVQRVEQLFLGAGYTCPRASVSKATKTAGAVQSVGQAAVVFLWPGSVTPRKQTSQEHKITQIFYLFTDYTWNLLTTRSISDMKKCLHPIDTSCYNTTLTFTVSPPLLRGWWEDFNLEVMILLLRKYRTQPAGPCACSAETALCRTKEG